MGQIWKCFQSAISLASSGSPTVSLTLVINRSLATPPTTLPGLVGVVVFEQHKQILIAIIMMITTKSIIIVVVGDDEDDCYVVYDDVYSD